MLRAVIDTNTWISGLVWSGAPRHVVQSIQSRQLLSCTSSALLAELQRVLDYPRIHTVLTQRGLVASELVSQIGLLSDVVSAPALPYPVSRDPDDDAILACAVAAKADLIVSGDKDLLVLQSHAGIPILTAVLALERLGLSAA